MEIPSDQSAKWLSLPIVATISRLLCQELTLQNEYLCLENKVLRSKIKGRIQFTDDERRSLVDAALAMGRKLMESVVNIVKPFGSTYFVTSICAKFCSGLLVRLWPGWIVQLACTSLPWHTLVRCSFSSGLSTKKRSCD